MIIFNEPIKFEWDKGNRGKNFDKHGVSDHECEEAFFDPNKKILRDILHSAREERYILLGQSKENRMLLIAFTLRKDKVRVISARDLNKKERKLYE